MYKTEFHTKKFDTSSQEDMLEMDEIQNDPLCTVLSKRTEKIKEEEFSEETGNRSKSWEEIHIVMEWTEKILSE